MVLGDGRKPWTIHSVRSFRGCWNPPGCGVGMEGRPVETMDDLALRRSLKVAGSPRTRAAWASSGAGAVGMKGKEVSSRDNLRLVRSSEMPRGLWTHVVRAPLEAVESLLNVLRA